MKKTKDSTTLYDEALPFTQTQTHLTNKNKALPFIFPTFIQKFNFPTAAVFAKLFELTKSYAHLDQQKKGQEKRDRVFLINDEDGGNVDEKNADRSPFIPFHLFPQPFIYRESGRIWICITYPELTKQLSNMCSLTTVKRSIQSLINANLIHKTTNSVIPNSQILAFSINFEALQTLLNEDSV